MKYFYRTLAIILALIVFGLLILGAINYAYLGNFVNEGVRVYGLVGIFALSFLLDLIPQYFSPHTIMIGGALFKFNPLIVLFIVVAGSSMGSLLGFFVGKNIRQEIIVDVIGEERNEGAKHLINCGGKWFVVFAAVSPLPYVPIILGSLNMSWRNFLIFGVIPRIIGFIGLACVLCWIF